MSDEESGEQSGEQRPIDREDMILIAEAHRLYQESFGTVAEEAALANLQECVRFAFARIGFRLDSERNKS